MKIGILTRRAGFNHGSSLQAYAMSKLFTDTNNGYECKIINYDEYSGHPLWRIRPFIESIQWFFLKHLPMARRVKIYKYLSIRASQYAKFQEFENNYFTLTSSKCSNNRDLRKVAEEFQVLVCGSDQIWSPLLYDPVYYFSFLKEGHNYYTVAYAPSMGISDSSMIKAEQAELIKKINHVSCREEDGSIIIKSIINRNVPVVLDPTLMIQPSEWNALADSVENIESSPYILCYFLGKNIPQEYISTLSKLTGFKILNIQMFNRLNALQSNREVTNIGPCEFLNLVKNAEWVCTDSFHATIFSYVFRRKMSVFERFKNAEKENQNSRIYTLLNLLKIKWALTKSNDYPDLDKTDAGSFDSDTLMYWQQQSLNFIKTSICNSNYK